jgi:hypothetical protein
VARGTPTESACRFAAEIRVFYKSIVLLPSGPPCWRLLIDLGDRIKLALSGGTLDRRAGRAPTCSHPRCQCGRLQPPEGEDEAGTLSRLKALRRELIDLKIAEHRGRIVKTTGDGLLVEFPSL